VEHGAVADECDRVVALVLGKPADVVDDQQVAAPVHVRNSRAGYCESPVMRSGLRITQISPQRCRAPHRCLDRGDQRRADVHGVQTKH
jgi:hypothetical protein